MTEQSAPPEAAIAALSDTTLAVRDLIGASQDLAADMARRMDMNINDMKAILMIAERGSMGAAELARLLGVSSAATTMLVDRLEVAGHLLRVRNTDDRRRVTITETAAARAAALQAWLPAIEAIDEVCRSLSESEQDFARDLLRRLAAAMTRG